MFISFEGCDGVGKTTQIQLLTSFLTRINTPSIILKEPMDSRLSDLIEVAPKRRTEIFLFLAARNANVPFLDQFSKQEVGMCIADRYIDSTIAYQSLDMPNSELEYLRGMAEYSVEGHMPQITFLLDMDVKKSFARIADKQHHDRYEKQGLSFQREVRKNYLREASLFPERIKVIDADKPQAEIHKEIILFISKVYSMSCGSAFITESELCDVKVDQASQKSYAL